MLVLKLMRREAFASACLVVFCIRLALLDVIVDDRVTDGEQHGANQRRHKHYEQEVRPGPPVDDRDEEFWAVPCQHDADYK